MKAIVQERFGPPDVLQLVDTDPPEVGAGDVLVRVHAAALNPYDWHILRGDPLIARLRNPESSACGHQRMQVRRDGQDAADLGGVLGGVQRRVAEQGADRGQPGVAGGDGVGPPGLQVLKERGDHLGVQVGDVQLAGLLAGLLGGELQQQAAGVPY